MTIAFYQPLAEAELAKASLPNPFMDSVNEAKVWHFLLMEDITGTSLREGSKITGQFTPQQVTHDMSVKIGEAGGLSRSNPLIMWLGGSLETLSFQARLFSDDSESQTAREKFEQIKLLRYAQNDLKRPPLVKFFWGSAIPGGIQCFIKSISGVYDETREDGTIRGVVLNITIAKWVPFTIERGLVSSMSRTPTHVVKSGETYEMIANRVYGEPLLGVPLREQNPRYPIEEWAPRDLVELSPNEIIKLYPKSDLTRNRIKPKSHIFNPDSQVASDNRRYMFSLLGRKVNVLPKR